MRLLVCGALDFGDEYEAAMGHISKIHAIDPISDIVVSGAPGVGIAAVRWTVRNKVKRIFISHKDDREKEATLMLSHKPDLILVYRPTDLSGFIVDKANKLGLKIHQVKMSR